MRRRPRPYGVVAILLTVAFLSGAQYCGARAKACKPTAKALERAIYARASTHRPKYRRWVSKRLSVAVMREAKRTGLPPLALLAVAEVESHYGYSVKGAAGELGIFQLIRWDVGPVHALKHAPAEVIAWRRGQKGHWTAKEFTKHIDIATYVAAHEIAMHVKNCKRRVTRFCRGRLFRSSHMKPIGRAPSILARIGHYNSGTKAPRWYYLRKLGRAYRAIKKVACAKGNTNAK